MAVHPSHAEFVEDPVGIDVPAVTTWLAQRISWLVPPLSWARLPGGHSNFTYHVMDSAGRRFVVRRPPLGVLLPSAHDMQREFRVIDALWPTPVPVPEPLAFCSDAEVTGAPFYAMGVVEGRSLYTPEDVETFIALERRRDLGLSFIDVLAELHLLDPVEIGLGELGKADSYVLRQLRRWYASWNASKTAERPAVDDLHEFFVANAPQQGPVRVVHGDYGLHNCISSPDGFIAAVVDWEISTLGDPLADLAYALNAWAEPGESVGPAVNRPTTMPGFPRRDELLARYVERSGADVSSIAYYSAFNHWKTAAIIEGVYARYLKGQKSSEGVDLEALCFSRDRALEQAVVKAIELGYSGSNS